MKLRIESTDILVPVHGVTTRVWHGETERGQAVVVLVARVGVPATDTEELERFDSELREVPESEQQYRFGIGPTAWRFRS